MTDAHNIAKLVSMAGELDVIPSQVNLAIDDNVDYQINRDRWGRIVMQPDVSARAVHTIGSPQHGDMLPLEDHSRP